MKCPQAVVIGGRRVELDRCLPKNPGDWSHELARALAEANGISYSQLVQRVVEYVRRFWLENGSCPPLSVLEADLGVDRRTVMESFGGSYDAICILAGAEPPSGCLSRVLAGV
ncbi:TusE/DsrC/DsvC family sulfur relay protein [Pyrobaculum neutrophilum]|uniref:Siroheme-sulfite reductase gamma subunit-like protein n=1 Tax=Pyrobaculum neutrophilum (strain DSM 2338 / JCM 9278 / NBRC 100436 / V24Sta) TaxID=444157 RepID=B1YE01_PYRNV|nr:TusE/DsrC/DsvC family sulfur relay protein [Pyrobaculum neutrophilum]ACB40014.1 siroheme-sulfite reductase gamma subunit-like protein [Pyrobaculum neutrophilum V24Sta]